jgi:FkbM family methyltransferase
MRLQEVARQTLPPILYSQAVKLWHRRVNKPAAPPFDGTMIFREGIRLRIHPDCAEPFEFFRTKDPNCVAEIDTFLRLTKDKHRLLDVGALHGVFSLVFAAQGKRAVAVEPSPLAFARLLYNIHANDFDKVAPAECALSDRSGTLSMVYEWEHAVATLGEPTLTARCRPGDDLCAELGFAPDVVKIDVEGHEVKVLRGLAQTLESCSPLVFLELHPAWIERSGDRVENALEPLEELGYTPRDLAGLPISFGDLFAGRDVRRIVFEPPRSGAA